MKSFPGIGHVALTVSDLSVSAPWYGRLFGLEPALDEDVEGFHHTVFMLPAGQGIGLHQFVSQGTGGSFSEFRAGLDHVAFGVAERAELEEWARHLDELGIEHGGIVDAPYGSGLSFRDPDNIALEFFAPPAS
ncbi:MAG: VOC family protein [Actinomycetia bacterium]|nr:VOC family protein [Actinomycetes bacterium]